MSNAAASAAGREAKGIMVPPDILTGAVRDGSDQVAGNAGKGGNLVEEILLAGSFIDILRNTSILPRLGTRMLTGLQGDVAIPKQTGATAAYWVAEDGAPTRTGATFGQVKLTPHSVAGQTEISRRLLLQSALDVESLIRGDLAQVIALAIDHAALNGHASANAPVGLRAMALADGSAVNRVNTANAAGLPTYAEVVSMWTRVAEDNAALGTLSFALHPTTTGHLMTTPKFSGGETPIMVTRDNLMGYAAPHSNQVTAGESWFGSWSEFILAMWSGLDLTVDPYTRADTGAIRVVAFQDVDFGVRHEQAFCLADHTPSGGGGG